MKRTLFLLLISISLLSCTGHPVMDTLVEVTGGTVQGVKSDSLTIFKGIPFAAPPVGELRWKAPQPVIPWEGVRDASQFGGSPMANTPFPPGQTEDCLYLNVWTPAEYSDEKLPVMVWIYGGGFSMGSSSFYDGAPLAKMGVVLVTINYRVGRLGFFAHPELSAENPNSVSGNYGILDQIAALEWVRDNISGFGGDPSKVTIFGESAGGISVSMLCASPLAKGLFRGAISQSGSSFGPISKHPSPGENMRSLSQAEQEGVQYAEAVGASSLSELRAIDASELSKQTVVTGGAWPVVDGYVIPDDQYRMYSSGNFNDVAILVGYNSDEGDSFEFNADPADHIAHVRQRYGIYADRLLEAYPLEDGKVTKSARDLGRDAAFGWGTWSWARLQEEKGKSPVYMYYFDQDPGYDPSSPKFGHGSPHGQDVNYVFKSLRPDKATESDLRLSDYMVKYWTNFAKNCNPNADDSDLPAWPRFTNAEPQVMVLTGEGPHPSPVVDEASMWVLDEYFAYRRAESASE